MEKDIGRIKKNDTTDIVIRIDDFGGKVGLTIREYTVSDRYTGFTKSGTRIPAESFTEFKKMINTIQEKDLEAPPGMSQEPKKESKEQHKLPDKKTEKKQKEMEESEEIEEEF